MRTDLLDKEATIKKLITRHYCLNELVLNPTEEVWGDIFIKAFNVKNPTSKKNKPFYDLRAPSHAREFKKHKISRTKKSFIEKIKKESWHVISRSFHIEKIEDWNNEENRLNLIKCVIKQYNDVVTEFNQCSKDSAFGIVLHNSDEMFYFEKKATLFDIDQICYTEFKKTEKIKGSIYGFNKDRERIFTFNINGNKLSLPIKHPPIEEGLYFKLSSDVDMVFLKKSDMELFKAKYPDQELSEVFSRFIRSDLEV